MAQIQLGQRQVLECIILGIKNGKYQEAINLAQDYIDGLDAQSNINAENDQCLCGGFAHQRICPIHGENTGK